MADFNEARRAKDKTGITKMLAEGKLGLLEKGDRVRVLDVGFLSDWVKVRIVSGRHSSEVAWVWKMDLGPAGQLAAASSQPEPPVVNPEVSPVVPKEAPKEQNPSPTTPTAPPMRKSLGMSRDMVQEKFSSPEMGFTFKEIPLLDGRPRICGDSRDKRTMLELIGNPGDLEEASLMTFGSRDEQTATQSVIHMMMFVAVVFPELLQTSKDWLPESVRSLCSPSNARKTEAIKVIGNKQIRLAVLKAAGMLNVFITPVSPGEPPRNAPTNP